MGPDGYAWMLEKIRPFWGEVGMGGAGAGGKEGKGEGGKEGKEARELPPRGAKPVSEYFRNFIYSYNVREESRRAVQELDNHLLNANGVVANGSYANGNHANGVGAQNGE